MARALSINADDIGLSHGITDAILRVADAGALDGVSIIANGEALSYALSELEKRPSVRRAGHANLTEGKSLTSAPLLTTSEGFFRYSPLRLGLRYLFAFPQTRARLRVQVRDELRAQYQAVGKPDRVDGHQHVHMVPFVFDELVALPGVCHVRIAHEPLYLVPSALAVFLRRAVPVFGLSILAFRNRRKAAQKGIVINDYCIGVLYSGHLERATVAAGVARLPEGHIELIVHPATALPGELKEWEGAEADTLWHTAPEREREREMLMAPGFRESIMTLPHTKGRVVRFVVSGSLAAAVHISTLFLLARLGVWYLAATTIGFCVAFTVSFSLQKWWTFKEKGRERTRRQLGYFFLLQVVNLFLNGAGVYVAVQVLHAPLLPSQVLVLGLLACSTYVLSSLLFSTSSSGAVVHLDQLLRIVPDLARRRILDIGAGRGAFLIDCAQRQFSAEGVEYNPANIRIAQERAGEKGLSLILRPGRAEALPYPDSSFDFINLCEVIEHVGNPHEALREVARVLSPGGKAYISVPNRLGWYDPHFHLPFVNWLPRAFADRYIAWRGRGKDYRGESGEQRLSQMHYYTFSAFALELREVGLVGEDARVGKLCLRYRGLPLLFVLGGYYLVRPWYFRTFHFLALKRAPSV